MRAKLGRLVKKKQALAFLKNNVREECEKSHL